MAIKENYVTFDIPFGEVFFEERDNVWNMPYLFSAKEFDEETGMYYYGTRYYDPRMILWISVEPLLSYDPMKEPNGDINHRFFNVTKE